MSTPTNDNETLNTIERWLEGLSVVALVLLFALFMVHQVANTGFFTTDFGTVEMLYLYLPIPVAMIAPLIRALTGRRHPARLWAAASSLLTAVAALWLLINFPFSFAHFTDIMPGPFQWMFFWLNDAI